MLTGKQRAQLRTMANTLDTIIHIGKSGITDTLVTQAADAITARELIKGRVQENAPMTAREACTELAGRIGAEEVQVIGHRFVLYRENRDLKPDKRIRLTK